MKLAPLSMVIPFVQRFERDHSLTVRQSGLFDLRPELNEPHPEVLGSWPDEWPIETKSQGVYLFLDGETDPRLIYVGKSEGRTSTIYKRLCGYFDWQCDDYKLSNRMVLREEWHGQVRPWPVQPRYFLALAMNSDSADGRCRIADTLETAIIREFNPPQAEK